MVIGNTDKSANPAVNGHLPLVLPWAQMSVPVAGLAACTALLVSACHRGARSTAQEYRSYVSPGGRFKMVVYRAPTQFAMPGQAGDAPEFVRLYDQRSCRILEEKDVEMVQNVDQFDWSPTVLYIKLFADWKLPK